MGLCGVGKAGVGAVAGGVAVAVLAGPVLLTAASGDGWGLGEGGAKGDWADVGTPPVVVFALPASLPVGGDDGCGLGLLAGRDGADG